MAGKHCIERRDPIPDTGYVMGKRKRDGKSDARPRGSWGTAESIISRTLCARKPPPRTTAACAVRWAQRGGRTDVNGKSWKIAPLDGASATNVAVPSAQRYLRQEDDGHDLQRSTFSPLVAVTRLNSSYSRGRITERTKAVNILITSFIEFKKNIWSAEKKNYGRFCLKCDVMRRAWASFTPLPLRYSSTRI